MMVTIFTPTFNRANKLDRLYRSLCQQTCKDFEWLIVDDGSSDDTRAVVEKFKAEGRVNIRYEYQDNGGKHRAINRGLRLSNGEYFFIVDSDDVATPDAVEFILKNGSKLIDDDSFAGLSGTDVTFEGEALSHFPNNTPIDATALQIRNLYAIRGDLAEVFKTRILKKYPFPEIPGERFCPEVLVWNRIAKAKYKLRYFPHPLKTVEYLPDGLTSSIVKIRMKSPVAASMCYAEMLDMDIPFKQKVKAAINYWRFRFCPSSNDKPKIRFGWRLVAPAGYLMYKKDQSQQ